jgi:hypothetical protein
MVALVAEGFKTFCAEIDEPEEDATPKEPELEAPPKSRRKKTKAPLSPEPKEETSAPQAASASGDLFSDCKDLQSALTKLKEACGGVQAICQRSTVSYETVKQILSGAKTSLRSDVKSKLQSAFKLPERLFNDGGAKQ